MEISGNTKPKSLPSKKKEKRVCQSKYWCFTWNNYGDAVVSEWQQMLIVSDIKFIMGYEVGEKMETPHIQGYLESEFRIRPSALKYPGDMKWSKIHWEKRSGTALQAIKYCAKDGKWKRNGLTVPRPLVKVTYAILKEWQKRIADIFKDPEDPLWGRKVYWFWEPEGKLGKTALAKYFVDQMDALVVGGKVADAKYGIAKRVEEGGEVGIVVFNIPRCNLGKVSYEAIEAIKDGLFFSPKYESTMVRFNSPHVIVFANDPPELSKLSRDRWVVEDLSYLTTIPLTRVVYSPPAQAPGFI